MGSHPEGFALHQGLSRDVQALSALGQDPVQDKGFVEAAALSDCLKLTAPEVLSHGSLTI